MEWKIVGMYWAKFKSLFKMIAWNVMKLKFYVQFLHFKIYAQNDLCETTSFNIHFICHKCGRKVHGNTHTWNMNHASMIWPAI